MVLVRIRLCRRVVSYDPGEHVTKLGPRLCCYGPVSAEKCVQFICHERNIRLCTCCQLPSICDRIWFVALFFQRVSFSISNPYRMPRLDIREKGR